MGRMRVIATGGAGFIGGALVRALRGRGDDVTAIVRELDRALSLGKLGVALVGGDLSRPGLHLSGGPT